MLAQLNLDKIEIKGIPGFRFGISGAQEPARIISYMMRYVFGVAGIILLIMLISAGYQMIFSKGDPKAMEVARGKITTSLIGIVILFTSFWVVQLIFSFLGVDSNIQIIKPL